MFINEKINQAKILKWNKRTNPHHNPNWLNIYRTFNYFHECLEHYFEWIAFQIKIPMTFFTDLEKTMLKFIRQHKIYYMPKQSNNKRKAEGIKILDINIYCRTIMVKTGWYKIFWEKDNLLEKLCWENWIPHSNVPTKTSPYNLRNKQLIMDQRYKSKTGNHQITKGKHGGYTKKYWHREKCLG